MEILGKLIKPKGSLKKLLRSYLNQAVGMNYDNPAVIKEVTLASINDDHFSVLAAEDDLIFTFPISTILQIVEGVDGVSTGSPKSQVVFPMVIRVSHRMV